MQEEINRKLSTEVAEFRAIELEKDETALYLYLSDLIYETINPSLYILIFEKYLSDYRSDIKGKCIEALLFALQIKDENYKKIALKCLIEPTINENFDLKIRCISGLGSAFFSTKDKDCIEILFKTIDNKLENDSIRVSCLYASLGIFFSYSTRDIFLKIGEINPSFPKLVNSFQKEFNELNRIAPPASARL